MLKHQIQFFLNLHSFIFSFVFFHNIQQGFKKYNKKKTGNGWRGNTVFFRMSYVFITSMHIWYNPKGLCEFDLLVVEAFKNALPHKEKSSFTSKCHDIHIWKPNSCSVSTLSKIWESADTDQLFGTQMWMAYYQA